MKIGFISKSGAFRVRIGDDHLLSTSPFDAKARYPEGGANQTIFILGDEEECFGEMEHMSGLKQVAPGEEISIIQYLKIE